MQTYRPYIPIFVLFIFLILLLAPGNPHASLFSGSGSDGQVINLLSNTEKTGINTNIIVNVDLNTQNQNINAVGLIIDYDPTILKVTSVDTSSSFCTLYTARGYTQLGKIVLDCGKPNPGFSGENILETISFQAQGFGNTQIAVDPKSLVLENDGKGTNILKTFEKKSISVILTN